MSTPHLRAARTDEAALLSDLALRSKGYWGYDQAFMDACRAELTLTPQGIEAQRVTVAERDGRVVGFYALAGAPPEGTLEDLFVEPEHIGTGVGRTLWEHAVETARTLGFERLTLEADPGAEPFYLAMGARRCGSVPSGSIPGRFLPLLELSITGAPEVLKRSVSQARPVGGTTRRLTATPASGQADRRPTTGGDGRGAAAEPPLVRRGELDLLRALVVVGLVFFHTAVIFGAGEFPVKAATDNRAATVFLAFGATWGMPLLFLISGMGICYSLRSRSPTAFARERLRRLGIPLLVGLLTLVPLQVYLGQRRAGDTSSYAGYFTRFWDVRPTLDFPFVLTAAPDGVFETGHLWFLVCVLAFSLVLLPGFTFLRCPQGTRLVDWLARLLARPVAVLLPALPLVAVEVALGSEVGHGGWNPGCYALFLAYGFLAAGSEGIGGALQRQWRPAAALGVLLFVAAGAAYAAAGERGDPFTDMGPFSMAFRLLKSVDGWLWVVAILGLASSRITSSRRSPAQTAAEQRHRPSVVARVGAYANEAVLPFYVLHETIIVVLAYFMLAWPIGAAAQYCLIAFTSLAATVLVYDLGVRRTTVARFLFGLKPIRGPIAQAEPIKLPAPDRTCCQASATLDRRP